MKVENPLSEEQAACLAAVQRINNELHHKFGWNSPDLPVLSCTIAGFHMLASISLANGIELNLFNSSDNDRIYYEKSDKYEEWYSYLKRKFREVKSDIEQIKL